MNRNIVPLGVIGLVAVLFCVLTTTTSGRDDDSKNAARPHDSAPFSFTRHYVDLDYGGNGRPGWIRAGDVDLDGDVDLVVGGGNALFVYLNDGDGKAWKRTPNLDGTNLMGANAGVLIDVDQDGDLDVVSALYYRELGWWENPGSDNIALTWTFRSISSEKWFLHDLIVVDIDGDGERREIVANLMNKGTNAKSRILSFNVPEDPTELWLRLIIQNGRDHGNDNHAGLDVGDIDQDGRPDIAFGNGWYRNPKTENDGWRWKPIHNRSGVSNVALRDLTGDGRLDVVTTLGHRGKGIYWYEATEDGPWKEHLVHSQITLPESLAVIDLDADGDLDIVTADLDDKAWNQEVHNVYVFENSGNAKSWRQHNVSPNSYPCHLLQVVDINGDERPDICAEGCGYSVITYLENASSR